MENALSSILILFESAVTQMGPRNGIKSEKSSEYLPALYLHMALLHTSKILVKCTEIH